MKISRKLSKLLVRAYRFARENNNEYVTPEHLLYSALDEEEFIDAVVKCNGDVDSIKSKIRDYIDEYVSKTDEIEPEESIGAKKMLFFATQQAAFSENEVVGLEHLIAGLFSLKDCYAVYFLEEEGITKRDLLMHLCHIENTEENKEESDEKNKVVLIKSEEPKSTPRKKSNLDKFSVELIEKMKKDKDTILVGREDIVDRTVQILCRKTKNNPIHIGEPGVGKTSITMGLAKLIVEDKVPEKLKNAKIFSLDLGAIVAGSKYRGDFEERIKSFLDEVEKYENPIVYIDEIHNIVGSGALNGGALDGASLIKGYLLEGKIRFIGATTFDEYKKHFEKDKGLTRRFQTIEVKETSVDETIDILEGLKDRFEEYHNVTYTKDSLVSAVALSNKYINDKFLPDKAIDIIDEAGAFVSINNEKDEVKIVNEDTIEEIISKMCRIPKQSVECNEIESLKKLDGELKSNIFGQDTAIEEVVRCIKMSRAGLNDDNKPVASMLFVGPTGVGKTEIAKTLAKTLGIELVRFDMSEYTEKHAASKLIGSPPGYVGYDEGGLLTDTIRKKPNCVLLLDEIEKANGDILNVLLQVMDYANLTDNKGRKADFRNVIIIMTSNAGAKNIGKSLVGFGREEVSGEAIDEEVKKVFSPEFRNRLDRIITFNHINEEMSLNIVRKELRNLEEKLVKKNIKIAFTEELIKYVAKEGISREFGARELLRLINSQIKPLLVDKILFDGFEPEKVQVIDVEDDKYIFR